MSNWLTRWTNVTPALVLAASMGACIEGSDEPRHLQPLDTATLGFTAAANLRSAASSFSASTDWMEDGQLSGWLGDMATDAVDSGSDMEVPVEPVEDDKTIDEIADELADRIEQEFLLEANVESNDGTTVIYLIPAERICQDVESDGAIEGDDAHAACIQRFTAVPLRVKVTSFASNDLDLALLVGEPRYEPLAIELHQTKIALTADVGDAFQAAKLLGEQDDDPSDEVVIRNVSGAMRVALEKRGPRHVRATWEVSSPLAIDASVGEYPLNLSLGRSKATVDVDADTQRVVLETLIGALKVGAPYQLLADLAHETETTIDGEPVPGDEAPRVSGTLNLDLAGFSGNVTLDDQDTSIDLRGLGLGDHTTSLKLDGATVFGLDLNASNGRKFDLNLRTMGEDEPLLVGVSPKLELVLELGLRHLSALDADLAEGWAADDTIAFALDGSSPALSIGDELKVISGRLALSSRARPDLNFEVQAGQCLIGEDDDFDAAVPAPPEEEPEDSHPFAGFSAGQCGG